MNVESIKVSIKKSPLGWSAALVAVILLGFTYLRHGDLQEMQGSLTEKMAEGDRLKSNVTYSTNLSDHLSQLIAANEVVNSRLVKSSDLAINLQYFYKLEAETGVKLVDLQQSAVPAPVKNSRFSYSTVPYSVKLEGRFPNILLFLRRLEQGSYYARVLSADIGLSGTRGEGESSSKGAESVALSLGVELLGKPL